MEILKLPEICEIKTGKMDANHAVSNGKYRFYTCANHYSMCNTKTFSGPCVIVPGNGDIGLVFYYEGDFEAYQRTYVLQNIRISPKYLYYHLCHKWRDRNSDKQFGSTVRYVRMANFASYEIPVPSTAEQERIVARIEEMFSELDAGVETLKKTKAQLAAYRQAVVEDAIKTTKNHGATAKPFGEYVSQYQNGISKRSGEGTSTPVLRLADIDRQRINTGNGLRNIGLTDVERSRFLLNKGDLLIIRVNGSENNVGRSIIVDTGGTYAACDHFIRCKVDSTKLLTEYAQLSLDSFSARKYIKDNMVSSAGQNTVSQTTMNAITVYVPEIPIQKEIMITVNERLSICDSIEQTVDAALQQAEAMRQSILKEAFEGRL